jgi:hypothetical protein
MSAPPGVRERLTQALGGEENADKILSIIGLTQQTITCENGFVINRWVTRWEG